MFAAWPVYASANFKNEPDSLICSFAALSSLRSAIFDAVFPRMNHYLFDSIEEVQIMQLSGF